MPEFGDVEFIKQQRKNREALRRLTAVSGKKYVKARFVAEGDIVFTGRVSGECIGIIHDDFELEEYTCVEDLLEDFGRQFEQCNPDVVLNDVADAFVEQGQADLMGIETLVFDVLDVKESFKEVSNVRSAQLRLFDDDNKTNK